MFNLGYKQVVINDGLLITQPAVPGNQIHIEGFGWFTVGESIDEGKDDHFGEFMPEIVGSTSIIAPVDYVIGNIYTVRLYYNGTRVLSDMWTRGDTMQFQTYTGGPNAGTFFGELYDGMFAAMDDYAVTFDIGTATFTFKDEYFGITAWRVTAKKVDCSIDDRCIPEEDITDVVVEGDEGQGNPRQVEASIRMSTDWSQEPYRIQTGGNESVDFEGEYNEYVWNTFRDSEESVAGDTWSEHEMANSGGGVNTDGKHDPVRYVVYLDRTGDDFAAADVLLQSLIVTV